MKNTKMENDDKDLELDSGKKKKNKKATAGLILGGLLVVSLIGSSVKDKDVNTEVGKTSESEMQSTISEETQSEELADNKNGAINTEEETEKDANTINDTTTNSNDAPSNITNESSENVNDSSASSDVPSDIPVVVDSGETNENLVWISENGEKYHSKSSCSNMESPWQVDVNQAIAEGRTACKKCY